MNLELRNFVICLFHSIVLVYIIPNNFKSATVFTVSDFVLYEKNEQIIT